MSSEFVCYHVTTRDRLKNIMREGLMPNSRPNWFSRKTPYIMLSLYPYWWLYDKPALIEIKDPAIKREYFDDPEGLRWDKVILPIYFHAIVVFKINSDWQALKERE